MLEYSVVCGACGPELAMIEFNARIVEFEGEMRIFRVTYVADVASSLALTVALASSSPVPARDSSLIMPEPRGISSVHDAHCFIFGDKDAIDPLLPARLVFDRMALNRRGSRYRVDGICGDPTVFSDAIVVAVLSGTADEDAADVFSGSPCVQNLKLHSTVNELNCGSYLQTQTKFR